MIKTVLKSQTEVGLSIEGMQEKNCMQNGRRYRQKSWPELLNIQTRPNGYELRVGEEKFFFQPAITFRRRHASCMAGTRQDV